MSLCYYENKTQDLVEKKYIRMDGSVKFGLDFHQQNCPIHCPHLCALGYNRIMLILYFSWQFAFLTWDNSLEQRHMSGVFANLNNFVSCSIHLLDWLWIVEFRIDICSRCQKCVSNVWIGEHNYNTWRGCLLQSFTWKKLIVQVVSKIGRHLFKNLHPKAQL